ncbi:MAG: glutathione S-transferase N-terminal domain-containing protein [Proteobacteria bacterium]|nr:glutathione S-transferase N-terminal domain-containing protein [Pseudomonadota bacterium]
MAILRKFIGAIILFFNWVFTPRGVKRDDAAQAQIDGQTIKLKLYQFNACPFCVKVRRAMKRLSLNIETRDAKNNQEFRQELESSGGKIKVPCLRIADDDGNYTWMYESSEIISYLQQKFA